MPTFSYKVIEPSGRQKLGKMDMNSSSEVANALREKGYRIIYIREAKGFGISKISNKETSKNKSIFSRLSKISVRELSIFTNQFGTMLNAGLSISKCLSVLEKQTTNKKLANITHSIADSVNRGESLSRALAKYPDVFSNLYVSMVKAGEKSGTLGNALLKMSSFLQRDYETRNKIKGAMMYPVAVLIFAIVIIIGLFIFVIPKFESALSQLGAPLPGPTKMVFALADFLVHRGWLVLIVSIVLYVLYIRWTKTPAGRRRKDAGSLKMPIFGELNKKAAIARFSDTFATLFGSGVPLIDALQTVRGTIDNVVIGEAIDGIIDNVRRGESLAASFEKSGMFTTMLIEMTGIGEESGSLEKMLRKVAEFYNEEVDYIMNNFEALINPIMIVFVGGLVGSVVIALYLPIFKMASFVH